MSSNTLMMITEYGGGGPPPVAGSLRRPVCAGLGPLDGDLKTAWRLSFSDESALEVSVTQDAQHKSMTYLTLPLYQCVAVD